MANEKRISESHSIYTGVENVDYVECKVRSLRAPRFTTHMKTHGLNNQSYKELYDSPVTCKNSEEHFKTINPWNNHGGQLSVFSKNYSGYADMSADDKAKAASSRSAAVAELLMADPTKRCVNIEYYLAKGMTQDEAEAALIDRQATGTLAKFIKRYGLEEGTRLHTERQIKWQNTLKAKSPEEIAEMNRKKMSAPGAVSKTEQKFFKQLNQLLGIEEVESQFALTDADSHKTYLYDMKIGDVLVEFNGDFWHANPDLYDDDWINPTTKTSAKDIHAKDAAKRKFAEKSGFRVVTVWERDFRKNPEDTLIDCVMMVV